MTLVKICTSEIIKSQIDYSTFEFLKLKSFLSLGQCPEESSEVFLLL